jgi:hypothetical protein
MLLDSNTGLYRVKTLLRRTFSTKGKIFTAAGVQKAAGLACNTTQLEPEYAAILEIT